MLNWLIWYSCCLRVHVYARPPACMHAFTHGRTCRRSSSAVQWVRSLGVAIHGHVSDSCWIVQPLIHTPPSVSFATMLIPCVGCTELEALYNLKRSTALSPTSQREPTYDGLRAANGHSHSASRQLAVRQANGMRIEDLNRGYTSRSPSPPTRQSRLEGIDCDRGEGRRLHIDTRLSEEQFALMTENLKNADDLHRCKSASNM